MTNNPDVVLKISNQGHDPAPTPTGTSSDQVPIPVNFQPPTPTPADEIDRDFIEKIQEEIDDRLGQQNNSGKKIIKIQKVPRIMSQQKKFEEDYKKPREMPIGPIYAGEENPEQMKLKRKLVAQFIITSGRTCAYLLGRIKEEINTLKGCFGENLIEGFSGDDDKLARMLFLDGCCVLQFIYSKVKDELKDFQINYGQASVIEQDLFLMENQIPYRVLEILMGSLPRNMAAFTESVFIDSIDIFIGMNLMTPNNYLTRKYNNFYEASETKPVHLLDILYSGFLYGFVYKPQNERNLRFEEVYKREYFRNIQDLKAVGIKLESSKRSCLREVTFTSILWFRARLKIPPLIVDDSTARKLWNLIAYEMCPENCNSKYGVTSYLSLLDSLIDSEEDVKDLRSAHILRNRLSCDADVAKLFNEIGYNVVSDQAYGKVKHKIQKHCDCWLAVKMSQLYQEYFSSPWSFIALLGAIAALALTATQTHFAIHPANPAE